MVRWGGLKLRTSQAALLSVQTAVQVCKQLALDDAIMCSLEAITSTSPAAVALAPPAANQPTLLGPSSSTPARYVFWGMCFTLTLNPRYVFWHLARSAYLQRQHSIECISLSNFDNAALWLSEVDTGNMC